MPTTILVADDESPIVEIVAAILEDEGCAVKRAYDGAQALRIIQDGGIDLLITDNMMPHLSGVELIDYLHNHPDVSVPVILMSAVTPVKMPPYTTFLPKPFDIDQLASLVAEMVN
jgi:DNA-binding NtrC family response regulator